MSEAGPGVKKNIRFSREDAELIERRARELGLTFAGLIAAAVRAYQPDEPKRP